MTICFTIHDYTSYLRHDLTWLETDFILVYFSRQQNDASPEIMLWYVVNLSDCKCLHVGVTSPFGFKLPHCARELEYEFACELWNCSTICVSLWSIDIMSWKVLEQIGHQTSSNIIKHHNATSMPPCLFTCKKALSGHGHADGHGPWPWRSCAEGMNGINGMNGTGRDEQAAIRSLFWDGTSVETPELGAFGRFDGCDGSVNAHRVGQTFTRKNDSAGSFLIKLW